MQFDKFPARDLVDVTPESILRKVHLHELQHRNQLHGIGGPGAPHVFNFSRASDLGQCFFVQITGGPRSRIDLRFGGTFGPQKWDFHEGPIFSPKRDPQNHPCKEAGLKSSSISVDLFGLTLVSEGTFDKILAQ